MNRIWGFTVIFSILYVLAVGGDQEKLVNSLVQSGEQAIALIIGLGGVIAFWSGLNRVAEKAGLITAFARLFSPIFALLFPSVRKDEHVLSLIMSNFCANFFGLGNAATPLGLEAMRVMQEKNHHKDTATDAMCTLILINATGLTLFPATSVSLRMAAGSDDPMAIIGSTFLAGVLGLTVALIADRVVRRWHKS